MKEYKTSHISPFQDGYLTPISATAFSSVNELIEYTKTLRSFTIIVNGERISTDAEIQEYNKFWEQRIKDSKGDLEKRRLADFKIFNELKTKWGF